MRDPRAARSNHAAFLLVLAGLIGAAFATACERQAPEPDSAPDAGQAIRAVLELDSELGTIRNHASETGPLAQAVGDYVRGLDELDFSQCPADFAAAFERHRDAWRKSEAYFEQHDQMRGEMHDLFDAIRSQGGEVRTGLEDLEREIWGTWAEVEAAAERHGVGVSS